MKLFVIKKVISPNNSCTGCAFLDLDECLEVAEQFDLGDCDRESVVYKLETTEKL